MKSCCVGGSLRMAATSTLPCTSQVLTPATAGECPLPFFYEGQSSARPDGRGSFLQNIQNGMACRGWVASAEIDYNRLSAKNRSSSFLTAWATLQMMLWLS